MLRGKVLRGLVLSLFVSVARTESGIDGWLRYARIPYRASNHFKPPKSVISLAQDKQSPIFTAGIELQKGIEGIFGRHVEVTHDGCGGPSSIVVGTVGTYNESCERIQNDIHLETDGFLLSIENNRVLILGQNERGALYGAFEYLSRIGQGDTSTVFLVSNPDASIRWTNEWNNMDGTIERGYAGQSIFFANNTVLPDLQRVSQYARLLASIKINGVILTNVNANPVTLSLENIKGLGRIADAMRPYGIQIGIALNFASPKTLGGLPSYDPLDSRVISWWKNITETIYQHVPDLGGYLVKANSEGQHGPGDYNRTFADGANMFARLVEPRDGIIFFRTFVYELLNITDWKADRAAEAYRAFQGLDGAFDENVILQTKYGPLDFQGREPPHPLFGYFEHSNQAIELQIAQEYTGQQSHTVYLPPLWKTVLDADLQVDGQTSLVRDIVSGKRFKRPRGGYCGVVNAGSHPTWTGSHLSMANLYAFGRLSWNPMEEPGLIVKEWSRLTFGPDPAVTEAVEYIAGMSWPAYQNYTSGDIGLPSLTDVTNTHFGPNVRAQDDNHWGIWTRSDSFSIGMDRTAKNGSGFAGQYSPAYGERVENIETTPAEFLLWYHHVNYTHRLPWGSSVIQHLYDTHYSGAETAETFVQVWKQVEGRLNQRQYEEVLRQLQFQAGSAVVWRDSIVDYYYNLSRIPDELDRVGKHLWRIEAEKASLSGYKIVEVEPIESASNASAVAGISNNENATAIFTLEDSGERDIVVVYFDVIKGVCQWEAFLNDRKLGNWLGDTEHKFNHAVTTHPDGGSKVRVIFEKVKVEKGDILSIISKGDNSDIGVLDYVAVQPHGKLD